MRLNDLHPAEGSRPEGKRVGRGIGSGLGKTGAVSYTPLTLPTICSV